MLNFSCGKSTRYFDWFPDDFSLTIPRYFKDNVSNVLPRLLDWHYLLTRCFALTYDPINNKSKVNKPIIFGFVLVTFPPCFLYFSYSFSCNSMPCSRCSALHGVGLNEKNIMPSFVLMISSQMYYANDDDVSFHLSYH